MYPISDLLKVLELEQLEDNVFSGVSKDIGSPSVFGGQVLAQALYAATQTVASDRFVHSLHGYFILPGDIHAPIEYRVDRVRDGRSFATRRVIAHQHGKAIFVMAASFQIKEEGLDHQIEMLNVPPPESLLALPEMIQKYAQEKPAVAKWFMDREWPIDFRPVEDINPFRPGNRAPFRHVWMRSHGALPDETVVHRYALAYASDFNLLISALLPHNVSSLSHKMIIASIDHAMWFHRDFRMDDWLLYAIDSPSASNARGFCRGSIFTRDGVLVASVTQEGLIRLIDKQT